MRYKPIVAFGDSITRGHMLSPEMTWPWLLSRALQERLGKHAPEVINAGGNGNTTRDGLARIQADVLAKQPGLVLVEFGGNDAGHNPIEYPSKHVTLEEFVLNLRRIHALVTEAGGQTVFMTFTPVIESQRWPAGPHVFFDAAGGPDAFIGTYRQAMRELAQELGRPLFDLERVVNGFIKTHGMEKIMDKDGVHLTVECNELVAKAVAVEVMGWLEGRV